MTKASYYYNYIYLTSHFLNSLHTYSGRVTFVNTFTFVNKLYTFTLQTKYE